MSGITKTSATITANGSYLLASSDDGANNGPWFDGTVMVKMTGTGTWKLQASPDKGTTSYDLKNDSGVVASGTANDMFNFRLGNARQGDGIQLWITVSGASGLSLVATTNVN